MLKFSQKFAGEKFFYYRKNSVKIFLKSCTDQKKVVGIFCRNFLTQLIVGIALQKISCRNFLAARIFDQIEGRTPLCLIKGDPTMFNK